MAARSSTTAVLMPYSSATIPPSIGPTAHQVMQADISHLLSKRDR